VRGAGRRVVVQSGWRSGRFRVVSCSLTTAHEPVSTT